MFRETANYKNSSGTYMFKGNEKEYENNWESKSESNNSKVNLFNN